MSELNSSVKIPQVLPGKAPPRRFRQATVTDEASVGKKRKASDVQGGPLKKRNVLESDDEE